MKKLVLVENNHLMRLGLCKLLSGLSNDLDIISLDLKDIRKLADVERPANLVVLGLPLDPNESDHALAMVEASLRPERTLVLTESSAPWGPADSSSATSVYACIEKHASTDTLMAAVQFGMRQNEECVGQADACLHEKPFPPSLQDVDQTSAPDSTPCGRTVLQDRLAKGCASTSKLSLSDHGTETVCDAESVRLTPRQYEVLELLACGHPIKTVARMMAISTATAKAHTASLYRQLDVNSKGEAVYIARRKGVLPH